MPDTTRNFGSSLATMFAAKAAGCCPMCRKPTDHDGFRDTQSAREARISGMCQPCQDGFFEE